MFLKTARAAPVRSNSARVGIGAQGSFNYTYSKAHDCSGGTNCGFITDTTQCECVTGYAHDNGRQCQVGALSNVAPYKDCTELYGSP